MRYFTFFVLLFITTSCDQNAAFDKPENLIEIEKMEEILYDLLLMQSIHSNGYVAKNKKAYFANDYIYLKYNIDSLQLTENELYYSKFPKIYLDIHKRVLLRLIKIKDSMETKTKEDAVKAKASRKIP